MLFQTPTFLIFFVAVLLLSGAVGRRRTLRHVVLLAASYVFYMAWNQWYVWLIVGSTALDYLVGGAIARSPFSRRRKALLAASLVGNLGLLGLFKYYGFFTDNIAAVLGAAGVTVSVPALDLLLPVGISFYTFQSLSYTIDIYRGHLTPARSFLDFALFVAFFPQLVAGPIVRAGQFLPQLDRAPLVTAGQAGAGLYLVLKGLVKKVVFADVLGQLLVDPVFADPGAFGGFWVVLAILGFKLQIYGDFAGYSDIAIGCGRMLGFELPTNFRSPYKAASISEYWSRWHITLGAWFRDYVYMPLGGSRGSAARVACTIVGTFLLVGLWHGASWTFVLWGGFYGVAACVERLWTRPHRRRQEGDPITVSWLARVARTLLLTSVAGLVFRAASLEQVALVVRAIGRPATEAAGIGWPVLTVFALAAVTHFFPERGKRWCEARFVAAPAALQAVAVVAVLAALRLANVETNPFYYFQF